MVQSIQKILRFVESMFTRFDYTGDAPAGLLDSSDASHLTYRNSPGYAGPQKGTDFARKGETLPAQATAPARSAATQHSATQHSRWLSRSRLIALFWVGTVLALVLVAYTDCNGPVGWDSMDYWKTIQDLRQDIDPYAKGIAATRVFQSQYVPGM